MPRLVVLCFQPLAKQVRTVVHAIGPLDGAQFVVLNSTGWPRPRVWRFPGLRDDHLLPIRQPLQSASKRDMKSIATFQCMAHRRGESRILRTKRLEQRRPVGPNEVLELAPGQLVGHDLTASFQ